MDRGRMQGVESVKHAARGGCELNETWRGSSVWQVGDGKGEVEVEVEVEAGKARSNHPELEAAAVSDSVESTRVVQAWTIEV